MTRPPYLKNGDYVGIVATARKISENEISNSLKWLQSWGLNVVLAKNLFNTYNQFAGTDEQRASDLQQMLDNPEIKAIFCARGGYGTVRIIDKIDFSKFIFNPKWIVGYSDITVLHSHINKNFKIETLHATMPFNFPLSDDNENNALKSLKNCLFGNDINYLNNPHKLNKLGQAEGILVGGNLSIIYSLIGSISDFDTNNKILFLEDIDEYLYHIDRMIINLKRNNKLSGLKGLIIGGMSDMKDNQIPFGISAFEIIADAVKEYDYPVCFDFSAGHIIENKALILGRNVKLDVNLQNVNLNFVS